ncbi:hypothetical protein [Kitasatospora sp. LaBMicrA B282]|uniref:hypothetical protein n=1 Tax=Kitasatospora sp. LaBMicrA B282 TaxID=3420949 RepID=UPI003D09B780
MKASRDKLTRLFTALALMIGALVGTAWAAQTASAATAVRAVPATSLSICSNSPIPSGYVVTAVFGPGGVCSGNLASYTIQTPYSPMSVCSNSPIPSGYVVTAVFGPGGTCSGNLASYTIQTP